ncbi:hypothetical protein ACH4RA_29690 [Streptomyces smyrnaeus]|uniref:hypothetical protein n=1 Tax=Streptomyces TaxID=1883 RepID=UPI000C184CA5|nr:MULTISPECIES: hypothetical protein [unclassified Streptomyces]MBQ0866768.1 hypothetical protein [Streptomyces sp. RK75]MBQ1123390.1 hypothetical protein [Streptomyces sp. B15]MBQ1159099.1 hypothetical protein [Streptomyces sp. A73]
MRKTRMAATAAGIALIAGLTACGGEKADGGNGSGGGGNEAKGGDSALQGALAALKKASTATDKQHSAKVEGVNKQTSQGRTMSTRMKGAFDWSGGGMKGEADLTMGGGAQSAKAIYLPDAMFVQPAAGAPGGKKWMKYDYDTLAEKGGASGAMLKDQMQNNNPARSVQLVLASGKVKALGTETVRGKKTTHYSGTISVSELTRMQSKDLSEKDLQALEQQFKQQGLKKEKIDLWIDENDLLVKKHEVAKSTDGATGIDATNYYTDYGTSVEVTAPPAGETTDAAGLMTQNGGRSS